MFRRNRMTKDEFAEKWEEAREKYYRLAYCYTRNEHDALEILSEATYQGYCHLHQLKQPDYFDTWMCRIIIREAYRFLKQKRRWGCLEEQQEGIEEAQFQAAEDSVDVYRYLDELSMDDRTLLILKYFEERSFREMAEILSIPENTVKTRIYRLLKQLRGKEDPYGGQ